MPIIVCPCGRATTITETLVAKQIVCPDCGRVHLVETSRVTPEARFDQIVAAVFGAFAGMMVGVALLFLALLFVFLSAPLDMYEATESSAKLGPLFFLVTGATALVGGVSGWIRKRDG